MPSEYSLVEQLAVLTEAVDEPGADVHAIIDVLMDDISRAVPSFAGLTITLVIDGAPVILAAIEQTQVASARSSLRLPLRLPGSPPVGHLVLYAKTANAFAGLATDAYRIHQVTGQVRLDRDLVDIPRRPDINRLSDQSDLDQAIGLLIDRGYLPSVARAELDGRAAQNSSSPADEARALLDTIPPPAAMEIGSGTDI